MAETWTSVGHAAELLGCERETILRWMASGELKSRGSDVCLMIEAANSIDDMAGIATNDSGREAALGVMLAKLAQDDTKRAERVAARKGKLAGALAMLLVGTVGVASYDIARYRSACVIGGEMLLNAQSQNEKLMKERDELRDKIGQARADVAELRGKLDAVEKLREADARERKATNVIDTIVAMLP